MGEEQKNNLLHFPKNLLFLKISRQFFLLHEYTQEVSFIETSQFNDHYKNSKYKSLFY